MSLRDQAADADDLRQKVCAMLKQAVPANGLSSDDPRFSTMTGLNSERLRKNWRAGGIQTSCNSFAGWVAQQIGAKVGSALCCGKLDLSGVEKEVPGSWVWANTGEAIEANLHPLPGDFYCSSIPGQQFAHVGIVVEIDEATQLWKWVAGGQGGPATSPGDVEKAVDYIRWGPWMPKHSRTFSQARPKVVGWVDIGSYFFPPESDDS
jgi:hypothetical protein